MARGSWMLRQLDYATRAYHVAADAPRVALLEPGLNRERYVDYLTRTFAFEAPVEARWQAMPRLATVIEVAPRLRTGYLAADLRVLDATLAPVVPAHLVGIEQALGWMYVVERGRRMNGLVQRHLVRRLPAEMEIAGKYLATSSSVGLRWEQLGRVLDEVAHDHATADQIINAAHRAFRTLRGRRPASAAEREHAA